MTRPEVRAALAQDIAPWDNDFKAIYARVLERVRVIAGGIQGEHVALPLQGAGHFAIEAAVRTFIPPGRKVLIPATGRYSESMIRLTREAGRIPVVLPVAPNEPTDPLAVEAALEADPSISHVGQVYSETGSGVIHDAVAIGTAVRRAGRRMILDAVSAFGALPLDLSRQPEIDAVVFTSNKCIEALPGIAFAVSRIDRLNACTGQAGSWSLDLADVLSHAPDRSATVVTDVRGQRERWFHSTSSTGGKASGSLGTLRMNQRIWSFAGRHQYTK